MLPVSFVTYILQELLIFTFSSVTSSLQREFLKITTTTPGRPRSHAEQSGDCTPKKPQVTPSHHPPYTLQPVGTPRPFLLQPKVALSVGVASRCRGWDDIRNLPENKVGQESEREHRPHPYFTDDSDPEEGSNLPVATQHSESIYTGPGPRSYLRSGAVPRPDGLFHVRSCLLNSPLSIPRQWPSELPAYVTLVKSSRRGLSSQPPINPCGRLCTLPPPSQR